MHIPCISFLTEKKTIPERLLLLTGPIGAGKTMYCKQFFEDGILDGDYCIYISSSLTNKQFRTQFSNIENLNLIQNSKFINPYLCNIALGKQRADSSISPLVSDNKNSSAVGMTKGINGLSLTLAEIDATLTQIDRLANDSEYNTNPSSTANRGIRVVVDSLTHLLTLFGEDAVLKFMNELSFLLRDVEAMAIFTLTSPVSNEYLFNALSSIFDGIIEMKIEDHHGSLTRGIRLLSIKGVHAKPSCRDSSEVTLRHRKMKSGEGKQGSIAKRWSRRTRTSRQRQDRVPRRDGRKQSNGSLESHGVGSKK
jgi:KaiC/GvpD/RAD55 family RecA-like ATPase